MENAQDATEKRRQLEIEKQITPELAEKYKAHADKEEKVCLAPPLTYHMIVYLYRWQWSLQK